MHGPALRGLQIVHSAPDHKSRRSTPPLGPVVALRFSAVAALLLNPLLISSSAIARELGDVLAELASSTESFSSEFVERAELERLLASNGLHSDVACADPGPDDRKVYIARRLPNRLMLRQCATGESLHLASYSTPGDATVYLLAAQSGNHGQTWSYEVYRARGSDPLSQVRPESVGLSWPSECRFKRWPNRAACTGKERVVPRLDASGVLVGEPWTWMRPEWAGHDVRRRVEYRWNGTRFMEQWVVLK